MKEGYMEDKISIKERIKQVQDIKKEMLFVKDWDVEVEIRTLSGVGRAKVLSTAIKKDGSMDFEKMYTELLLGCVFDPETGEHVFDRADIPWMLEKSSGPIELIANKAMTLSGLTPESTAVIEKNSGNTQSEDSILN